MNECSTDGTCAAHSYVSENQQYQYFSSSLIIAQAGWVDNIKKKNGFLPVIADCQLADDKSLCTALLHFHLITFICQLCVHNPCTDYDKKLLGMLLHFLSDIESFAAIRKTSPRITFS